MAVARRFVVAPVIVVFLVLSAAAAATTTVVVSAARPLAGDDKPSAGATAGAGESVIASRFLRQRPSGPGHSCQTWNPNGGC